MSAKAKQTPRVGREVLPWDGQSLFGELRWTILPDGERVIRSDDQPITSDLLVQILQRRAVIQDRVVVETFDDLGGIAREQTIQRRPDIVRMSQPRQNPCKCAAAVAQQDAQLRKALEYPMRHQ